MTLTKIFPPPAGQTVLGVTFALIAVAAVTIGTRLFHRLKIQKNRLAKSDYLMILALCGAITCASFDVIFWRLNVLRPRMSVGFENYNPREELVEYIYKMSWASEIPFYATTYLSKAILLALYFHIFPSFMGRRRRALWFTVIYCILAYVVTLSMQLFSCMPLERHWVISRPMTACDWRWQGVVFQVSWALSFLANLFLLILPFTVVHDLDLTKRARTGMYIVSMIGVLDIAISLIRFLNVELGDGGEFRSFSTIEFWSSLDVNIGLITACLPALRVLLGRTRKIDDYMIDFDEAKTARSSRAMEHRELEDIDDSTYLGVNSAGPSNRSNRASRIGEKAQERQPERSWRDEDGGDDTDMELDNINVEALKKDQAKSYWSTP
ncbi:integral membrane protein [Fusarium heterosporum]|uniref:Integral membrane protein n=1 Tax=Fusarium heterosporum TaxID=42747 RepID=A0A8H5WQA9_FUSHE|nr:integral membrane protein [Fusarium heterosporum]